MSMNCLERFDCGGICCNDGVYLDRQDKEKIEECLNKYPDEFSDEDFFEVGTSAGNKGKLKTRTTAHDYQKPNITKNIQTKCVFQTDDGKCKLQTIAEKHSEDKWEYKPKTCRAFPLILFKGEVLSPIVIIDEENGVYNGYSGPESILPCITVESVEQINEIYSDEIDYLLNRSNK